MPTHARRIGRLMAATVLFLSVYSLGFQGSGTKISGLTAYSTQHASDLLVIVDVSDTTMGATGTDKKVTTSQLFGGPSNGNLIGWEGVPTPILVGSGLSLTGSGPYTLSASGGSGTVTSVGLSVPSWLSVSGSPVTSSGTLAVSAAGSQTANQVLATPNGSSGAVGLRAIAAADLPSTGLNVTAHYGSITTDTDGSTVTFDCSVSDWHQVQIGGNRTLAVANVTVGQQFSLIIQQDGTGSRTVTWFSGILWPSGTAPTLTTTASKRDVFTFKCVSTGVYLGFVAGQSL